MDFLSSAGDTAIPGILASIVEKTNDAIVIADTHQHIVFANAAFAGMTGYDIATILTMSIRDFLPPDEADRVIQRNRSRLAGQSVPEQYETRLLHKDGTAIPIELSGAQTLWQGASAGLAIIRDISKRTRAKQAMRESDDYLQSVFRAAPVGIGVVADRVLQKVNKRLCDMIGYTEEELVGNNARLLYPSNDDYEYVGREKYRQIAERGTGTVETRWRRKNGNSIHVLLSSTPVDPDDLSRGVTFTALDITDRKRAEQCLRENEKRLRSITEHAQDFIFIKDAARRYTFVNPAMQRLLGMPEEAILGKTADEVFGIEQGDIIRDVDDRTFAGETVDETKTLVVGGTELVFNTVQVPLDIVDGTVVSVMGIVRNITERRQAEEELQRMQKLESLSTVAGGIAHDFNNMLTGIFGTIQVAMMGIPDDHESAGHLKETCAVLENARQLTSRLLTFAKGGAPLLQTVNTREVVQDTVNFNLSGSSVRPRFDLQKDLWPIHADKGQISQVLANLTINAREAMPGGGHLHVEGVNSPAFAAPDATRPTGDCVRLTIRDEGTGIAPKIVERIFDPYFSTKHTGHGLGLAIVHSIISKHGGRISVHTTPDVGTTFALYLPAAPSPGPDDAGGELTTADAKNRRSLHILVMDDHEHIRKTGTLLIKHLGHTVDTAADGTEAVEHYAAAMTTGRPVDLVIMDLTVPGGTGGKEAVRELLTIDPRARVIVSSGYSSDPVMANYSDYGFSGCLVKPYTTGELRRAIADALEGDR